MIQLMHCDIIDNIYIRVYKPNVKLLMWHDTDSTNGYMYWCRCKVSSSTVKVVVATHW